MTMSQKANHSWRCSSPCRNYTAPTIITTNHATPIWKRLQNLCDVILHFGGSIGDHQSLATHFLKHANIDKAQATDDETERDKSEAIEAYMATEYVTGLNQHRFGQMLNNLHNDFRIGRDE